MVQVHVLCCYNMLLLGEVEIMVISLENGSPEEEDEKPYKVRTEALVFSTTLDFLAALAVPGML